MTADNNRRIKLYEWQVINSFLRVKGTTYVYLQKKLKSNDLLYDIALLDTVKLGPTSTFEVLEPASHEKIGYCFQFAYVTHVAYNHVIIRRPAYALRSVDDMIRTADQVQLKYKLGNLRVYEYADDAYGIFAYTMNKITRHLNRTD